MLLLPLDAFIQHDLSSDYIVYLSLNSDFIIAQDFTAFVVLHVYMYISLHGVFSALNLSLFHLKVLFIGQIWSTTCDCGLFSLLLVSPSLLAVFSHLLSKIFLCLNFSNLIFFLLQPYNFISGLQLHLKVFFLKLGQECKLFQLFLMSLQSIRHSRSHMASSKRIIAKHPSKPCFGHQYAAVNRESVFWRHLSRCHIVL